MPDWGDIAPAFVGLTGVLLGSAASWAASARVQRTQFNVTRIEASTQFITSALRSADFLYLVYGIDADRFKQFVDAARSELAKNPAKKISSRYIRDDRLRQRFDEVTEEWRTALTGRYLVVPDPIATELSEFDKVRARATEYSNQSDGLRYIKVVEVEMPVALKRLKLAANIELARMNLVLEHSMRVGIVSFRDRRAARKAYTDAITRYNALADADSPAP